MWIIKNEESNYWYENGKVYQPKYHSNVVLFFEKFDKIVHEVGAKATATLIAKTGGRIESFFICGVRFKETLLANRGVK